MSEERTRAEQLLSMLPSDEGTACIDWLIDNWNYGLGAIYEQSLSDVVKLWQERRFQELPEGF